MARTSLWISFRLGTGGMSVTTLTEAIAAKAFARAWNRLDPAEFIELLGSDEFQVGDAA